MAQLDLQPDSGLYVTMNSRTCQGLKYLLTVMVIYHRYYYYYYYYGT